MKILEITFNPKGDTYTAIYIDGKIFKQGDEYHNSMHDFMEGFKAALVFQNIDFEYEELECNNEDLNIEICEYADFSLIPEQVNMDFLNQLKKRKC